MWDFLREIAPVRSEIETGAAVSIVGTVFCYLVGGWDKLIEALLVAMVIDYISGMLAAYLNPEKKLSSQRGMRGIVKKVMIMLVVAIAVQSLVVWFFLGNEGLSIIENAANAGLPIPEKLKASLEQLTKEKQEGKQL